ncbi:succinyl-diaminopimelate desuccinylase [Buchnera aphidicola (Formosaphis micheliae)]|uniref:succinyl-diaminopimelate desuccinylase n=1 Tax=Buchnera aphidicola TaxID=9 RepID=UPI0031CC94D2
MCCPILNLAKQLIEIPSISPLDLGCQKIITQRLSDIGFTVEEMNFKDTHNLWATRGVGRNLTFLGHTDVVDPGKLSDWNTKPFVPVVNDGILFGRGSADMKGALAAMIVAVERFIRDYPKYNGKISFLITSDEESHAINGTKHVVEELQLRNEKIDYCLVGEPSSSKILGDTIKNGRRGSITADLVVYGKQGHVAYPHLANNSIHIIVPFLSSLLLTNWSNGNVFFPPTSLQIINITTGNSVNNMIPGEINIKFNFRFGNDVTVEIIKDLVDKILSNFLLKYSINWTVSAQPFLTKTGNFIEVVKTVIKDVIKIPTKIVTTGGTSDGRFVSVMGSQIIELGLINKTIHQVNEHISIVDLQLLCKIYEYIIKKIMIDNH